MDFEIVFNCPECEAEVSAVASLAGQTAQCLHCHNMIVIPLPGLNQDLELGDFILERKIGSGGMGEVWLALQISMTRPIALKILTPKYAQNKQFIKRFLAEAKTAGKLSHPNIITAYSAGHIGDYYYLATSYIDGVELSNKLKVGPISEREALKICKAIATALRYAWDEHRLLHRDIKPSNIMIDHRGNPQLMDMGISKCLNDNSEDTSMNLVIGTPDYISPEQARAARDIDFRADIYSMGASLYHMVTGRPPFVGESPVRVLQMHANAPLTAPEKINPQISKECSALIQIMMSKLPDNRQSSWDYVIADIDAVLSGRMPGRTNLNINAKDRNVSGKSSNPGDAVNLNVHSRQGHNFASPATAENSNVTLKIPLDNVKYAEANKTTAEVSQGLNNGNITESVQTQTPSNQTNSLPPKITAQKKDNQLLTIALIVTIIALLLIGICIVYRIINR